MIAPKRSKIETRRLEYLAESCILERLEMDHESESRTMRYRRAAQARARAKALVSHCLDKPVLAD